MSSNIQRFPSVGSVSSSCTASQDFEPFYLHDNGNKLSITRKLSDSRFPVFLAKNSSTKKLSAVKFFQWDEQYDQPSMNFYKEERFSKISHPNLVSITSSHPEYQVDFLSESVKTSYIVMDYAPNGDLFELVINNNIHLGDIIIRTYFHQLIAGLEAIHSQGGAHLDLKLENLLLDESFQLKIADFDASYMPEDRKVHTKGSMFYRAPEVIEGHCYNPQAADVYSLGIILFLLKTDGRLPFDERGFCGEVDMRTLLRTNKNMFWKKQCELLGEKATFFTFNFRKLFERLTDVDPANRPTLAQIKECVWFSKYTYSYEELPNQIIQKLNTSFDE